MTTMGCAAPSDVPDAEGDGDTAEGTTFVTAGGNRMPWDDRHPDAASWTAMTREAIGTLGEALLDDEPSDVASYCPKYVSLDREDRTTFWVGLLAAIARHESNYNPATTYRESFADSSGRRVVSRGLLQISDESARGYGCDFERATDLQDPRVNLECGVRILARWVGRDGVIARQSAGWRGGARYWSVLRKASTSSQIRTTTRSLSVCR